MDVLLKRPELHVPVRLQLIKPRLDRRHRLRAQPEHPGTRVRSVPLVGDEACLQQMPEVLAHGWRRGTDRHGQLARPGWPGSEQLNDASPGGVGKRVEEPGYSWRAWLVGPVTIHRGNI